SDDDRPQGNVHQVGPPGKRKGASRRPFSLSVRPAQQPAVHFPLPSKLIVLPLSGTYVGTLTIFMNASVLVPGISLPPFVARSLACDAITAFGFTKSLTT